ncbi:MAG: hypothetical protein ACP5QO_10445 [Clostridia bacterium]
MPLTWSHGRFWPQHPLPAGRSLTFTVTVQGLAGWTTTLTTLLTTPAVPRMTATDVAVPLGRSVTVHWSGPVAGVDVHHPRFTVALTIPRTTVPIGRPSPPRGSGESGICTPRPGAGRFPKRWELCDGTP